MLDTPIPNAKELPFVSQRQRKRWKLVFPRSIKPFATNWRRWTAMGVPTLLLIAGLVWWLGGEEDSFRAHEQRLRVNSGPDGTAPVTLDTTLYLPDRAGSEHRVPAVLLAHGFGGTKRSVTDEAERLATAGYAVMTWSARGFGASSGRVHLNHPDYEVNDARQLIDVLAAREDIALDSRGDPRVAAAGASYGGALALLLAGYDQRVDAVVPQITWNDLSRAFFPNTASDTADPTHTAQRGVFKAAWAGALFGNNALRAPVSVASEGGSSDVDGAADPTCDRLAAEICQLYLDSATTGQASERTTQLLQLSSPASILGRISAPTLLLQGTQDTLFPLSEADANARGIARAGTPVKVAWFTGGHDAGPPSAGELDRLRSLTDEWLSYYLTDYGRRDKGVHPDTSFSYSQASGVNVAQPGVRTLSYTAPRYPGLGGVGAPQELRLTGAPQQVANPPDGTPAALSSLPGLGALFTAAEGLADSVPGITGIDREINGQHARFQSPRLSRATTVVGAPEARLRIWSENGSAVLFAKLYDLDERGGAQLVGNAAAPLRLTDLSSTQADARPVSVTLPAMAHTFDAGHRLLLVVATADQAFRGPTEPARYGIALPDTGAGEGTDISLPSVPVRADAVDNVEWRIALGGAVAVVLVSIVVAMIATRWHRRRGERVVEPELAQTPLAVRELSKTYRDGFGRDSFVAVRGMSFTVEADQVVGLLGPNGAGKTTTLRMLLGLISPTSGAGLIFGHRVEPGASVLSDVGALVEGPGFLPHLSGRENLELYWRATGRPNEDSRMAQVLEIAALGEAIDRKARTYSHGMKQRLAIAQAMLGMPRLLMLDEPTDGLDPPQIAAMRSVLQHYATEGRAVLVSSHLLAEVEQTCSHIVVMHQGRGIAAGPVADVIGASPSVLFEVSETERATQLLRVLPGVTGVESSDEGLVVTLQRARSEVVAELVAAGIAVERVVPRRRLEDAFLALVASNSTADSGTANSGTANDSTPLAAGSGVGGSA